MSTHLLDCLTLNSPIAIGLMHSPLIDALEVPQVEGSKGKTVVALVALVALVELEDELLD
jgi:hypothetical protein